MWLHQARRIGLIPKKEGKRGCKYGFNPHEMRDIAKSLLHTKAKADGFDMDCCEFWLGHTVDPLGYDKFYNDAEYVRKHYLIAEKYLNILSEQPNIDEAHRQDIEKRLMNLQMQLDSVMQKLQSIR
jgi:hypothetical protein